MTTVVKARRTRKPAPLTITMPDLPTVPFRYRGKRYTIGCGILSDGDDNPKLVKSNSAGTAYRTWGIALAPSIASGYQVCSSASAGCASSCLHFQGRAKIFSSITAARVAKTIAFFEHRDWFEEMLIFQLTAIARRAEQDRFIAAVRPNILSDVKWEQLFPWMFTDFTAIQFYDYTKHHMRMLKWCNGFLPPNYHLTFSRSEVNHGDCLRVLKLGGNVAIVFRNKTMAKTWQGYRIVNGDETDLRFLDAKNVVVGLYAKGSSKQDESGFVVNNKRFALHLLK